MRRPAGYEPHVSWRELGFLLPTIGTGLVRLAQLGVLLVVPRVEDGAASNLLIAGVGLFSSFAMVTDSGAANFLLSTPRSELSRATYRRALALHAALVAGGSTVAVLILLHEAPPLGGTITGVLIALAATQALDSTGRVVRMPVMAVHLNARYAAPDLCLAFVKALILLAALWAGRVDWLLLLPVPSLVQIAWSYRSTAASMPAEGPVVARLYRKIVQIGLGGILSASYSQSPLIAASLLLPLVDVASLAIAYRVVQAVEIFPSTMSLQIVPRVQNSGTRMSRYWAVFFLPAVVVAGGLMLGRPVFEWLFGAAFPSVVVFCIIAASLPLKSSNYALEAYLLGKRLVVERLVAGGIALAVAVPLSLGCALGFGVLGTAIAGLVVELTFCAACAVTVVAARRRLDTPSSRGPAVTR